MQNLDTVIKIVKKLTIKDREFKDDTPHQEIINHTLEQQGANKVISILERINNGDYNLIEAMKNMK